MLSCLLLALLLCLDGLAPGSPAPQLTDLRSQISGVEELLEEFRKQLQEPEQEWPQDWPRHRGSGREEEAMRQQLQEVAVRRDSGQDVCNFNQLEDYIIRTKDSLQAGATFLQVPGKVRSWRQCLEECCSQPRCSAAVVESSARGLSCFLFDCSHHGQSVCQFSPHRDYSSFTLTGRNASWASPRTVTSGLDDKPPISNAGQDVVIQLPVDWVLLDGRESGDDHAIIRYEWTLLQGDPLVEMKVPQPGTLKLSHLQEGTYSLQLTVTDTSGQKSSDNVSITVLPEEHHKSASTCSGACTRYQFICDDGCCIDITLACDRVVQCPDGSDEAFCQNFSSGRKTVIHISDKTNSHANSGSEIGKEMESVVEKSQVTGQKTSVFSNAEKNRTLLGDLNGDSLLKTEVIKQHTTLDPREHLEAVPGTVSSKTDKDAAKKFFMSKDILKGNEHPAPEAGAVLPLALGLAITSLLLLMVVCRLQLVRHKLKKARPLTSEESDYLINGMYL